MAIKTFIIGETVYFQSYNDVIPLEIIKVTKTYIEAKRNEKTYKFTINGNLWDRKTFHEFLLNWNESQYNEHIENQNKAKRTNELRNNILMKIRQNSYIGNLELYEEINKLVEQLK